MAAAMGGVVGTGWRQVGAVYQYAHTRHVRFTRGWPGTRTPTHPPADSPIMAMTTSPMPLMARTPPRAAAAGSARAVPAASCAAPDVRAREAIPPAWGWAQHNRRQGLLASSHATVDVCSLLTAA